jgi:hypothetical protein
MRVRSRYISALLAVLFPVIISACGYYSVSGSLPGHIKTAAVPLFENETTEPQLVEDVTDAVIDAIIANGAMKIESEFRADAVVNGIIIDVIEEPDQFSKDEQAQKFIIRVYAHVAFFDRIKNRPLWEEERLEGWARYDATGSSADGAPVSRDEAKIVALDMLAKEIIDRTVAGW